MTEPSQSESSDSGPAMTGSTVDRLLSQEAIDTGYRLARADIGRFNLGIFGLTGVGKSTLLNAVFGAELAQTGIGDPVTQDSKLYRYGSSNLGIFDTKGLELGSDMNAILDTFIGFVDQNRLGTLDDQIHVIWYCIRAGDRRIQPAEESFIRKVAEIGIPVLLVMTQTPLTPEGAIHPDARVLAAAISQSRLPVRGDIRFVNARPDAFADVPSHGLDELLIETSRVAPEGVRNALAAAQQVDRKFKRARAGSLIDHAAGKLQGKFFLRRIDEVWAELFAGISEVYEMPETRSREVLDEVGTVLRVRRLLRWSNAGILVSPLGVGLLPVVVSKISARRNSGGKNASDRGKVRASEGKVRDSDEMSRASESAMQRVGSGLAAGKVTKALGQAWLETCDHFWTASYPNRATYSDTEGIANHFADDLQARLPAITRAWESWLEKRAERRSGAAD